METVAIYFETIIRTYGFDVRSGLTLAKLGPSESAHPTVRELTSESSAGEVDLVMTTAGREANGDLGLWVVVAGETARALCERHQDNPDLEITHPVDVVHFHGPHFGDRYGIANAAMATLRASKLSPLLMSCTGASVFLAVAGGEGERTVESLRGSFTTPQSSGSAQGEQS